MIKRIYLLVVFLFIWHISTSQTKSTLDFQNSAGSATVSIPLFEFGIGSINVPVYLSYTSNGMMYDDVEGNVGVGWSIHNLEFYFEQLVRGRDDLNSIMPNIDSVNTVIQSLTVPVDGGSQKEHKDALLSNFIVGISGDLEDYPQRPWEVPTYPWDNAYDLFWFNTFSGSGQFLYTKRDQPLSYLNSQNVDHNENIVFLNHNANRFSINNPSYHTQYVQDDQGFLYTYGHGSHRRGPLNNVISVNTGEELFFQYTTFYMEETGRERTVSIMEGYGEMVPYPTVPQIETLFDISSLHKQEISKQRVSKIITPRMEIDISYVLHGTQPLINEIKIYNRKSEPTLIKTVAFQYLMIPRYAFLKQVQVIPEDDVLAAESIIFDYYHEGNLSLTRFDRDFNGFAYPVCNIFNNCDTYSAIDSCNLFYTGINNIEVYWDWYGNQPWSYWSFQAVLPYLPFNHPINLAGGIGGVSDKNTLPSLSATPGQEGTMGILRHIRYPYGLIETFKYGYNRVDNALGSISGVKLVEFVRTIPKDGNLSEPDTVYRKMFVYADIDVNDNDFEDYYTYAGYPMLAGAGWLSNSFADATSTNMLSAYTRENMSVVNMPSISGNIWQLLRRYEVNTNRQFHHDIKHVAQNNIYFDSTKEITFHKDKPVRVVEYIFDRGGVDISTPTEVNNRNISYEVFGQGLVDRRVLPYYLSSLFPVDEPKLRQINQYELNQGIWRINKRTDYEYHTTNSNIILNELYIQDFARINPVNPSGRPPISSIYSQTGLDSFFDYGFYILNLRSQRIWHEKTVDYNYN